MKELITAKHVPDDYGRWRERCTGTFTHPPVPPWYTNTAYDSRFPKGTTNWQKFVRTVGLRAAIASRKAFTTGFTDVRGNHWCGHCAFRQRFIDAGERLGYPGVHRFYAIPETRDAAGYEAWLKLAREGNNVIIETVVRQVEAARRIRQEVAA